MQSTRVRLEYFDQNDAFGRVLPPRGAAGTLTRQIALGGWGDDWYVLSLDNPIEYDGRIHAQLLIRSRWDGHSIGEKEPTSVFILLVPDPTVLDVSAVDPATVHQVAWGMAHTLEVAR